MFDFLLLFNSKMKDMLLFDHRFGDLKCRWIFWVRHFICRCYYWCRSLKYQFLFVFTISSLKAKINGMYFFDDVDAHNNDTIHNSHWNWWWIVVVLVAVVVVTLLMRIYDENVHSEKILTQMMSIAVDRWVCMCVIMTGWFFPLFIVDWFSSLMKSNLFGVFVVELALMFVFSVLSFVSFWNQCVDPYIYVYFFLFFCPLKRRNRTRQIGF